MCDWLGGITNGDGDYIPGTVNPNQKLQIDQGNILVKGEENFSTAGDQGILYLGDTNHSIRSEHGFGLKLSTHDALDAIVLRQSTGNVGIGTTSPVRP